MTRRCRPFCKFKFRLLCTEFGALYHKEHPCDERFLASEQAKSRSGSAVQEEDLEDEQDEEEEG
jgi:hypothetical protein